MPAIVYVKVVAARDLPVMDRSSELTDAFVEVPRTVKHVFNISYIDPIGTKCSKNRCL